MIKIEVFNLPIYTDVITSGGGVLNVERVVLQREGMPGARVRFMNVCYQHIYQILDASSYHFDSIVVVLIHGKMYNGLYRMNLRSPSSLTKRFPKRYRNRVDSLTHVLKKYSIYE